MITNNPVYLLAAKQHKSIFALQSTAPSRRAMQEVWGLTKEINDVMKGEKAA